MVDCALITGVFGTNSSGKTSLIQFLLLLKQTKDATDRAVSVALNGELVQLGTIGDVIHQHNESATIRWSLTFQPDKRIELRDPSAAPTSSPFAAARPRPLASFATNPAGSEITNTCLISEFFRSSIAKELMPAWPGFATSLTRPIRQQSPTRSRTLFRSIPPSREWLPTTIAWWF